MGSTKKTTTPSKKIGQKPATTLEAREDQLFSLAMDRAEEKLLDGTASSQLITHFLKLGSSKERLERKKLEKENQLLEAKTESIKEARKSGELYEKAIRAFAIYTGEVDDYEEDVL